MSRIIMLTGPPGVGKSTALAGIARESAKVCSLDGMLSGELRVNGRREGFEVRLIGDGRSGILASPEVESDIRFGSRGPDGQPRLGVSHTFLNADACPHLRRLIGSVDLIVLDEIGAMQASAPQFRTVVSEILDSSTPLIASVSLAEDEWLHSIRTRPEIPVIELSRSNRDLITEMVTRQVKAWCRP